MPETPIDQLVQGEDCLHVMLDPTAERLPSELREMLYSAVDLHLYWGEVVAASARIAARESEAALRKELTK